VPFEVDARDRTFREQRGVTAPKARTRKRRAGQAVASGCGVRGTAMSINMAYHGDPVARSKRSSTLLGRKPHEYRLSQGFSQPTSYAAGSALLG
jgi:hypothetical protein